MPTSPKKTINRLNHLQRFALATWLSSIKTPYHSMELLLKAANADLKYEVVESSVVYLVKQHQWNIDKFVIASTRSNAMRTRHLNNRLDALESQILQLTTLVQQLTQAIHLSQPPAIVTPPSDFCPNHPNQQQPCGECHTR